MTLPAPTAAAPAAVPSAPVASTPPPQTPLAAPPASSTPPPADSRAGDKGAGRGSRIFNLLAEESATEPGRKKTEKTPPADPATPPADGAKPAGAPPADPAAGDKPIKATKKPAISKRPEPPASTQPAAPAPAAPAPRAQTDSEWESGLIDEEKQLIADAVEAEKHLPNRKGLAEQAKKFVREHQKYLEQHPEIDGDPEAEQQYKVWLSKNQPKLTEIENRTVTENRIIEKARKPFDERTQELEHELFVRDETPKIAQEGNRIISDLNGSAMPKEILEFAQNYGVDEAKRQFADELTIHNTIVKAAADDYQELIRLSTKSKTGRTISTIATNPSDPKFQQHERLGVMITKVCDDFRNGAPERELFKDGKWFCTRDEWNSGFKHHPDKYWTFSNKEIGTRSLAWVPTAIDMTIKQNREALNARGYERRKFTPPAPPAQPPQARSAPGPAASPVPPPTNTPPAGNTPGSRLANVLTQG